MKDLADSSSLCDHFLISMPHLRDSNFDHTLTYICEHNDQGAMGLVINRPLRLSFEEILQHLKIDDIDPIQDGKSPIYAGGPVQGERGFILHRPTEHRWSSSYAISDQIQLTSSIDILRAIAEGWGPQDYLITLGYAGWGAGQLEQEMLHNSWLSCPADLDILFATESQQRLEAAASKLGVNLDLLTSESGHA